MTEKHPEMHPVPAKLSLWRRALARVGIETNPASRWHVRLRPRFFAIVLGALVLGVIALAVLAAWSTSPSFCRSCHIMEPYYQAWANSKHKEVSCVECHYPPGSPQTILWKKFQALSQVAKFVTRTYSSKPYAEVEDASCLRSGCHAARLLRGRVVSEKGVLFDHTPHLVVGKHIEVTWDTCFLCHLKKPAIAAGAATSASAPSHGGADAAEPGDPHRVACLDCHLLPDEPIRAGNITYNHKEFLHLHGVACRACHLEVTQGNGEVVADRCVTCHNQPEKLARIGEVAFLHENHVTKHNTACFHCHREIRHGAQAAGTKPLTYDCATCHTDTHDLQRAIYRGVGARGAPPMPSPMYLANVDCVGCHLVKKAPGNGVSHEETLVGSEKGCTACHGPEYNGTLDSAHTIIREGVSKLEEKALSLRTSTSALSLSKADRALLDADLDDAVHNIGFVRDAHSVHNIYYAAQILRSTDDRLNAAAGRLKVKVADASELPVISGGFCATLCHAKVGVKVPSEKVLYKGREMPHLQHFEQGIACTNCHTFGVHKQVELRSPPPCGECHEE
ncbi:MAG: NapC/NirT family cytochrome c [Planctomycetes bacterium]|nr:NapC/NirT family cytochrome c [Planctomycetota bacterium]